MNFDGIITKLSLDDALIHYGVKGMKWKNRKHVHKIPAGQENNPAYQYLNNMTEGEYQARLKKVKLTKGSGGKSSSSSKSGSKGSGSAKEKSSSSKKGSSEKTTKEATEKTSSTKTISEAKTADDKLASLKNTVDTSTESSGYKRPISEDYTKYLETVLQKVNTSRLGDFKQSKKKR